MKTTTKKLRSPLKWHGGKSYLARRIVALMPPHRVYVEPFLGGGSVLLNRPPAEREAAGDLDPSLMEFWSDLARYPDEVCGLAWRLRYEESTFRAALAFDPADPDRGAFEKTFAFLVRNRFSRGGLGKDFAWSDRLRGRRRPGGPVPGELNAWDTIRAELPTIASRIADVDFYRADALELIRGYDRPDTLHYCDPPYLHATRTVRDAYAHEMTEAQHAELLDALDACRGAAMVSGYPSDLYRDRLAGWTLHTFDLPNHSGQGKTKHRRTECLWIKEAQADA